MVILGAGGHASEILDVLIQNKFGLNEHLFFFDNVNATTTKHSYTVLKTLEELKNAFAVDNRFIIGTGNPLIRQKMQILALKLGGISTKIIANSATISSIEVSIGDGVNIMHDVRIFPGVSVEQGALVNAGVMVHHNATIGEYAEIGPRTIITGNCKISKDVHIGAGCVLLPNIQIAEGVVIGAGTTVTKSILEVGTYVGSAHKRLK